MPKRWEQIERWLAWVLPAMVLGFHCLPLWRETTSWGGTRDWGYFFFLSEVERKTILEFGQFPLWNPYYFGGAVHLANPQTFFLSATFPFILLFGTPIGIRLTITAAILLAFDGVRRTCRVLGFSPLASSLAGTGYAVCGAMAQHLGGGHVGWLGFGVFPYVLWSFHRVLEGSKRHLLYGALFLAWILGHFGVYPFPYAVLGFGFYALAWALVERKTPGTWKKFFTIPPIMGVLAVCVMLVRMVPLLDFVRGHPRRVSDSDFLHFNELWEIYVAPHTERQFGTHGWVWPEYGNYFGPIGFGLVVLSIVVALAWKTRRPILPALLALPLFIAFQMGNHQFGPWSALRKLPIIENLRVPSRFTILVGVFACIIVGYGLHTLFEWLKTKPAPIAIAGVALLTAAGLGWGFDAATFNRQQWNQTFGTPPPDWLPKSPDFVQDMGDPNRMYAYPRANRGSLMGFEESPLDVSQVLAIGRPEEFLIEPGAGTVTRLKWTPNEVTVKAVLNKPSRVLVNQNYSTDWKVSGGTLVNQQGLLGADVQAGETVVTFTYSPTTFWVGLLGTLVTLGVMVFLFRRWKPTPPALA